MTEKDWKKLCEFLNIQDELFYVEVSEEYYETTSILFKKIIVPCIDIKIGDLPEIKISQTGKLYFREVVNNRIVDHLFAEGRTKEQIMQIIRNLL